MKTNSKTRWMTIVASALLAIAVTSAKASAAQITFQYFTDGCFGTGCTPVASDSNSGLSFANEASFTGTSVGGSLTPPLGTFTLDPTGNDTWTNEPFTLRVSFVMPTGIDGGQDEIFSALITGAASSAPGQCRPGGAPCGSVNIDFPSAPVAFTFNDGSTAGAFNLLVNDLTVTVSPTSNPGVGALTGSITGAFSSPVENPVPVPEPASLVLLGSGLVAAALARRHRAA